MLKDSARFAVIEVLVFLVGCTHDVSGQAALIRVTEHFDGIVYDSIFRKGHNTVAVRRGRPLPPEAHRQRKKWPLIEFRDRFASLIGRKVCIAQGHVDRTVTQKITHCVHWNAMLNQTRSKVMAQIVRAKIADPARPGIFLPSRLKSGDDVKDTRSGAGLFAPAAACGTPGNDVAAVFYDGMDRRYTLLLRERCVLPLGAVRIGREGIDPHSYVRTDVAPGADVCRPPQGPRNNRKERLDNACQELDRRVRDNTRIPNSASRKNASSRLRAASLRSCHPTAPRQCNRANISLSE